MKVLHRSDQMLVLEDKPWLIGSLMIGMALVFLFGSMTLLGAGKVVGALLMGLLGMGVPLTIAALMVQRVRLTLDRQTETIMRTSRSVRGLVQESWALDRLTEARLGVSSDSDGSAYRLELHLSDPGEVVPFTRYYTGGRSAEVMCAAINDWWLGRDGSGRKVRP